MENVVTMRRRKVLEERVRSLRFKTRRWRMQKTSICRPVMHSRPVVGLPPVQSLQAVKVRATGLLPATRAMLMRRMDPLRHQMKIRVQTRAMRLRRRQRHRQRSPRRSRPRSNPGVPKSVSNFCHEYLRLHLLTICMKQERIRQKVRLKTMMMGNVIQPRKKGRRRRKVSFVFITGTKVQSPGANFFTTEIILTSHTVEPDVSKLNFNSKDENFVGDWGQNNNSLGEYHYSVTCYSTVTYMVT